MQTLMPTLQNLFGQLIFLLLDHFVLVVEYCHVLFKFCNSFSFTFEVNFKFCVIFDCCFCSFYIFLLNLYLDAHLPSFVLQLCSYLLVIFFIHVESLLTSLCCFRVVICYLETRLQLFYFLLVANLLLCFSYYFLKILSEKAFSPYLLDRGNLTRLLLKSGSDPWQVGVRIVLQVPVLLRVAD